MDQGSLIKIASGILLCCLTALFSVGISGLYENTYVDPLVVALLTGILIKSFFPKTTWYSLGSKIASKHILEFSVVLLGASIYLPDVIDTGIGLFVLIISGVIGSMAIAWIVGQIFLKLNSRVAILIGVSNSICGNSAAAMIAPIIKASPSELTTVIGISGLLGAAQILLLPLLVPIFGLEDEHYGIVAGMSVYAVAQVYAASATVSVAAASVATFVKLVRVVLLAPLALIIQLGIRVVGDGSSVEFKAEVKPVAYLQIFQYMPWFVVGFLVLSVLRSIDVINEELGTQIRIFAGSSFLVAMVGIGINTDLRDIFRIGPKVACVIGSVILFMVGISIFFGEKVVTT